MVLSHKEKTIRSLKRSAFKMAEGSVLSKSRHECTICLETYKQPKLLPCHHTFCCVCLEKYIDRSRKGNKFECPLCRKETEVPKKGVGEFQSNFYIETEDTTMDELPCEGCDDNVAAGHRCLDCDEHFCARCTKSHMKMKATKHHKLMELTTTDPNVRRKIKARVFCQKHPNEEIKVVCKQCNQLLCLLCMVMDHQGHRSREVTEEAREVRESLKKVENSVGTTLTKQAKLSNALKGTNMELKTSLDREIEALRRHGVRLHAAVDDITRKMEETLLEAYRKPVDENDSKTHESETFSISLQSLATTARQIAETATDVEIIEKGESLQAQLLAEIDQIPLKEIVVERQYHGNVFTAGDVDVRSLQKMMGSVTEKLPRKSSPVITPIKGKLVMVRSIVAGDKRITVSDIAPVSGGRAWVCFMDGNTLELIDSTGKSLLSIDVGTEVYSATSDENGNCIISCITDRSIKRVTTTGKIETIVAATDTNPHGVAYRKRSDGTEEVIFSCSESGDNSDVFVAPYRINTTPTKWSSGYECVTAICCDNGTNTVCISDNNGASVIVLGENSELISEYNVAYSPHRVTFDVQGAIIIAENSIQPAALHRIKPDSTLKETLTNITGHVPAVDSNGWLWVGKDCGVIEIYDLK